MLPAAIESVFLQSYKEWQLIIVDNGSTDNTNSVVNSYEDDRIIYVYSQMKGRSHARNIGIEKADGEWLCFLDSDDIYDPEHLMTFYHAIKFYPEFHCFKTGVKFLNTKGKVIFKSTFHSPPTSFDSFVARNYVSILDIAVRTSAVGTIRFAEVENWEDAHFLLQLYAKVTPYQISAHTVIAMEHEQRSINKAIVKYEEVNGTLRLMKEYLPSTNLTIKDQKHIQENFVSSLIVNGFQSGMGLTTVVKHLSNIDHQNKVYYILKSVYYRLKY